MAITCSLTLNAFGGLAVPAAYIRLSAVSTYKRTDRDGVEQRIASYSGEVYLNAAARQDGKNPLDRIVAEFAWDETAEPNILAACYANLKAQETYAGAVDC